MSDNPQVGDRVQAAEDWIRLVTATWIFGAILDDDPVDKPVVGADVWVLVEGRPCL